MLTVKQISKVLKGLRNKNFKVESLDEIYVAQVMETLFHNLNNLIRSKYSYRSIKDIIAIDDGKETNIGFSSHEWDDDDERFIDIAVFDYSKSEIVAKLSQVNKIENIASVSNGKLYFHMNLIDVFDQE